MRRLVSETFAVVAPDRVYLEQPEGKVWLYEDLSVLMMGQFRGVCSHPIGVMSLRTEILGCHPGYLGRQRKRIFVGSDEKKGRQLLNEADVLNAIEHLGYTYKSPAEMSLFASALAVNEAEIIIGVSGE